MKNLTLKKETVEVLQNIHRHAGGADSLVTTDPTQYNTCLPPKPTPVTEGCPTKPQPATLQDTLCNCQIASIPCVSQVLTDCVTKDVYWCIGQTNICIKL